MYIEPAPGARALAGRIDPYFNRSWEHWSSHAQTPPDRPSASPAAILAGSVAYIAFPVFRSYLRYANRPYRTLVRNCIRLLLPKPLLSTNAPSSARLTLLEQEQPSRLVCHVLHFVPERRTRSGLSGWDGEIDIIEDVLPLHGVEVRVRMEHRPRRAILAPQGTRLGFAHSEGYASVVLKRVEGYQAFVLEA